jgi:hypothetical protein
MSQNDFSVANADGATVRADLNSALQALATQSSGTSAPTTTYAGQVWWDTTNNLIKIRNGSNNAWITIASFDGTTHVPYSSGSQLGTAATQNTGTSGANVPLLNGNNTHSGNNTFSGTTSITTNALDLAVGQIAFPAVHNPSSNANMLDDYEEGTWTPADGSGAALSFSNASGQYVKIGQLVTLTFRATWPATADTTRAAIQGFPFTPANVANPGGFIPGYQEYASQMSMLLNTGSASGEFYAPGGGNVTNANLSSKDLRAVIVYRASA